MNIRALAALSVVVTALSFANGVLAQTRPDFSGRWKLDTAATQIQGGGRGDASGNATGGGGRGGGGLGLGPPPAELIVQQDDRTLRVEERGEDDRVLTITYRLDGVKTANTMRTGRGRTAGAVYTSRWDGPKLVVSITRRVTSRGNDTDLEYRETRYLSDGTMVVETTIPGSEAGRRAVYRKVD